MIEVKLQTIEVLIIVSSRIMYAISPPGLDAVCESGDVQLAALGRVEYCRAGRWGGICLDSSTKPWSEKNAQVICKQLQFSGALNSVLPNEYVELLAIIMQLNLQLGRLPIISTYPSIHP